jgi:hypothetical protein
MEFTTRVKLAIYQHFADTGEAPAPVAIAERVGAGEDAVRQSLAELRAARVVVLEPDGVTIRMAAPFSGVPTPHVVTVGARQYYANCAWDSLGIPAALHADAVVRSECAHTGEPLTLAIGPDGPGPTGWVFHSLVPAARWWQDIVFT